MEYSSHATRSYRQSLPSMDRLVFLQWGLLLIAICIVGRLFQLQVLRGQTYAILASDQHTLNQTLVAQRGKILVRDRTDGTLHPLATNRDAWLLYVEPKNLIDIGAVARSLAPFTDQTEAELVARWSANPDDPYEPVARGLDTADAEAILEMRFAGVGVLKGWSRYYPESNIGGHLIGFVRTDDTGEGKGAYGIEGSMDTILSGKSGFVTAQKDAGGRRLMLQGGKVRYAQDGSDVVLTIDRTIQYETCKRLANAVQRYDAAGGSVVIMDPSSGAIMAMCSVPDFQPEKFGETTDIGIFNNPITLSAYEPGSVFKPLTMAIGIEEGLVNPNTTYVDSGVEKIDDFEIRNSDKLAHGVQTMREVLEKSLNTGTIFVERLLGRERFTQGVERFGFGTSTGIELSPESSGNLSSLAKNADVYGATASFGQGITVTPLQLVAAFGALANGGILYRPYIVDEIVHPDGTRTKTEPQSVGTPISGRTSSVITGMLVSVIERGHGKAAAVPGYYVAGKTGTAQVANTHRAGYLEGVTITSFVGYAPAENPAFVMVVRVNRPKAGKWAESNAAPLFQDIASFLLSYLEIPLERDVFAPREVEAVPDLESITGAPDVVSIDTDTGEQTGNEVQGEGVESDTMEGSASTTEQAPDVRASSTME